MKDRIVELIDSLGISKNEFAKQIGTSSAMISKITTQDVNFGIDIAQRIISTYPRLNASWLLTGIGDLWIENDQKKSGMESEGNSGFYTEKIKSNDEKRNLEYESFASSKSDYERILIALRKNYLYEGFGMMECEADFLLKSPIEITEKYIRGIWYDIEIQFQAEQELGKIINDFCFEELDYKIYPDFKAYYKEVDEGFRDLLYPIKDFNDKMKSVYYFFYLRSHLNGIHTRRIDTFHSFKYWYDLDKVK